MRLVTFTIGDERARAGAFIEDDTRIVDLAAAHVALGGGPAPELVSIQALIEGGDAALALAADVTRRAPAAAMRARAQVRLRAPVDPPAQMRDCSCFELHLKQSFRAARQYRARSISDPEAARQVIEDTADEERALAAFRRQPIYYKANRFAVVGAGEDVIWPAYSRALDFELEFGCYIGRRAKDVSKDAADAFIFGYTIFNDFSARDAQALEMPGQLGPAKGKDFDTSNAMGPCLVTADEIPKPYELSMIARVNGEEWGRGNSRDMHWRFDDVIAHISRSETLHPGEFLGSGTVGNGCGLEQMRYLRPGDQVELEVEGLGTLRNRVVKS
jgi:2-keto-4-pentenoate hydratase/2-oxohepta-3-ene-1,7-dioic acid hydratase in catechol pathway